MDCTVHFHKGVAKDYSQLYWTIDDPYLRVKGKTLETMQLAKFNVQKAKNKIKNTPETVCLLQQYIAIYGCLSHQVGMGDMAKILYQDFLIPRSGF